MKHKLIRAVSFTALSAALTSTAFANEVILKNISSQKNPVTITYKIAHKNANENTIFDPPQTVYLEQDQNIEFKLNGFQLAGMVIMSIDGHLLPDSINQFDKPMQCSLTTDKDRPNGSLSISVTSLPDGHGKISCQPQGGVFG